MADLTFVGAAGTVTGSKHLLTLGDKHFYVDCGMFQGTRATQALNAAPLPIPPAQTDAIVITHGHIDHVGYLPKIVKDGFHGPIYCTPATSGLIEIVLEDAAHLQDMMARRGLEHERAQHIPPFYNDDDVAATLKLLQTVPLETDFTVCGATLRYRNAGHILGSAFIEMQIEGKRAVFSGDVGRYGRPLLYDPAVLSQADVVVCETTYGDRNHPPDALGDFEKILLAGIARGGTIVIPAFAVERTQDILYSIGVLQAKDTPLASVPVHVDSPMAIKVDALFARYPDAHKPFVDTPDRPFGCRNVTVHVTTDESKQLNHLDGPAIVIASSGMATGGRILHHLHNQLANPRSTIVFPGFQGPGTLGNALVHGAPTAHILGDTLPVRAAISNPSGYSAHADQAELLRWLGTLTTKPHLYAVHGEPTSATAFAAVVQQRLGFTASVAQRGVTVTI
ncbi:MAG: MBL fold metallo-hydrolase [Candidatus Eremiobacteraeota bacterium]|nr:MBL fold metallo-hydrolase [Candidatus Eremiobacteraeota bacterium]